MRSSLALLLLGLFTSLTAAAEPPLTAEIVSVAKIWSAGNHNAFTDLVRHDDRWICTFREGEGHVSADGKIRVIASKDGAKWDSLAMLSSSEGDLRDPKICVTPLGELMITAVLRTKDKEVKHHSRVYFSRDGQTWNGPHEAGDDNFWLWRTSFHDGKAYAVGYQTHGGDSVRLYRSEDGGLDFKPWVEKLDVKNDQPNEASIAWDANGDALCLLRCEKPNIAQLGVAKAPYKEWTFTPLDQGLGGPQLIRHTSGQWLAAGRIYHPSAHTALCWIDRENHKLVELAKLPSGGDTSYPGLVWHEDLLWMSYYSSHEGKTSIYLAKLKVTAK